MRTCAVVNFSETIPSWLEEAHDKIYRGGSIGQIIRESGLQLSKENIYIGNSQLSNAAMDRMEVSESLGAVHIYQLLVENPEISEEFVYCTITEAHSPHYLSFEDLVYLFPTDTLKFVSNNEAAQEYLHALYEIDDLLPKLGMNN